MVRAQLRLPEGKVVSQAKLTLPTDWRDLTIDAFGDGSWNGVVHHTVVELPGWSPPSRQHAFSFAGPGDGSPRQDVTVKTAGAVAAAPAAAKPEAAPALKGDVAAATAKMTLDEMLGDPRFALDANRAPWAALKSQLAASSAAMDPDAATRLTRVQSTLSRVRPSLLALGAASQRDAYLPDIAAAALDLVQAVRGKYEVALGVLWSREVDLCCGGT